MANDTPNTHAKRTQFLSAVDTDALKAEMKAHRHLNMVIEADNPVQAVHAKRFAVLAGKDVNVINDFLKPTDPETREKAVADFRKAEAGTSVLIYVRPPSPSMKMIMEDHAEIEKEMEEMLSKPSDLLW